MNKRKLTAISTALASVMMLFGNNVSAKVENEYYKEGDTTYYEESKEGYHKNNIFEKYQWDIKRVTNNGASFYLETGNHDVVVGIIDTGIDTNHPDLKGNLLGGKNFVPAGTDDDETETGDINDIEDRAGHGTQVAGQIAANGNYKGVAPNIGIKCYRTCGRSKNLDFRIAAKAVRAAVDDGVNVINLSLGMFIGTEGMYYTNPETNESFKIYDYSEEYKAIKEAIDYAYEHNVVVVASAGNDGYDFSDQKKLSEKFNNADENSVYTYRGNIYKIPACFPNVITVSSTRRDDSLSPISNFGKGYITVAAPGGILTPAAPGGESFYDIEEGCMVTHKYNEIMHSYCLSAGTSLAAPKVSAEAALILCKNRNLTPDEVKKKICDTADKAGDEIYFGAGIINVYKALE